MINCSECGHKIKSPIYWKTIPYEVGQHPSPKVTIEKEDGSCLGFRYFDERIGRFICYMTNFYENTSEYGDFAELYMERLRNGN